MTYDNEKQWRWANERDTVKIPQHVHSPSLRVKFRKLHPDTPTPRYAKPGDAGFDLVATEDVIIEPGETAKVPTGLAVELPAGYELQVRPRSGVSLKTKLRVVLGTVDSSYRGEIGVIVDNIANPLYEVEFDSDELGNRYNYRVVNKRTKWAKKIDGKTFSDGHFGQLPSETYFIEKGTRIAQAVISRVPAVSFHEVDELSETLRGDGGFGSTGVNSVDYDLVADYELADKFAQGEAD